MWLTLVSKLTSVFNNFYYRFEDLDVTEVHNWPDSNVKFGQIGGLAYMESYKSYQNVLLVFHRANRVWDEEK